MHPPPAGPTRPEDYALINGVYLAGIVGVAVRAARSARNGGVPLRGLPVIGAAAFALSDVLSKQKVTTWLREPFVEERADHKPVRAEGSGLRYALGELVTGSRCVGSWCALGLVGLRIAAPGSDRAINAVSHVRFDAVASEMARQPRRAPSRVGGAEPSGPL